MPQIIQDEPIDMKEEFEPRENQVEVKEDKQEEEAWLYINIYFINYRFFIKKIAS